MADTFSALSVLAIVAGGVLSAFSARRPTRQTAWASAYLVLIVGIIQLGLVAIWRGLGHPGAVATACALLIYNLGSGGVIVGTLLKARLRHYRALVNLGGGLIAAAMVLLLLAVAKSRASLPLAEFIALVIVILVSMPVGLVLSGRRHKLVKSVRL